VNYLAHLFLAGVRQALSLPPPEPQGQAESLSYTYTTTPERLIGNLAGDGVGQALSLPPPSPPEPPGQAESLSYTYTTTPERLIGNLAGDFVKGPLHDRFTPGIRQGIQEHRRIDAFTDSHPSVAAFRRVLIPEHGHWSRVIADVFFDHFLACDFESYAHESLDSFVARVHRTFDQHVDLLPDRLRTVWPYMRDQQWLLSYRHASGIEQALRGLSHRIARHPPLFEAVHHLHDSREELLRRFRAFFPDVMKFAS